MLKREILFLFFKGLKVLGNKNHIKENFLGYQGVNSVEYFNRM